MKLKNIKYAILAVLALGFATACQNEFEEVDVLSLGRCLQPMSLKAKVSDLTGDQVTFSWDVTKDADHYHLQVFLDEEMTTTEHDVTLLPNQVPYTVKLTADSQYWFRVKAISEKRGPEFDSKWAVYEKSVKTFAVKDNLFLKVAECQSTSVALNWSREVDDYLETSHLTYAVAGDEDNAVEVKLEAADIQAASKTIEGLNPSTNYVFTLYYLSAKRGQVDVWTLADPNGMVKVSDLAALKAQLALGSNILLSMDGSPYELDVCDVANGVHIYGEASADGALPVIKGEFHFADTWAAGSSVYFESVELNGNNGQYGFPVQKKNGGTADNIQIASIIFRNCVIDWYSKGLIYEWGKTMTIGELTWDSCDINNVNSDGSAGGDVVDFRGGSTVDKLNIVNNTVYQGMRTFVRIDAGTWGDIKFENNTLMNLCFVDNTNNAGIFGLQVVPSNFSFKNNLFLNFVEKATLASANTKYKTADDMSVAASNNWFYNVHDGFFTDTFPKAKAGFNALEADPCFNAKGGWFNLTNSDLVAAKVGASKWWTPYVEEPEDLTWILIEGAHTWNFGDAKFFASDFKRFKVRDALLVAGSEEFPVGVKDGKLVFSNASVLNKKGVPQAGYLAFMVNKPGSVVIKPADEAALGNHFVVAVGDKDGTSVRVKGGAAALADMGNAQKILISDIAEESIVYIYSSGAIELDKLAWSEDVSQVNTALPAPAPATNPASVTAGEDKDIVVSWDPVENAGSYSVVFSGKTYAVEAPVDGGGYAYVIAGSVVKMLDAGSYKVEVYANPGEMDIYNTQSSAGTAAFAILPAGGSEESEEFIVDSVQSLMDAIGAGKDAITLKYSDTPYEIGAMTITTPFHLKGQTVGGKKTPVSAAFTISGEIGGSVVLTNLDITNAVASVLFEDKTADCAPVVDTVAVYDCYIHGTKALYDNSGKAVSDVQCLIFKGNVIDGCSDGADFIDLRTGAHHTFQFVNNTVANSCRTFLRTDAVHEMNYATIRNNTFYKVATNSSSKDNNGIFHVRSAAGAGLLEYKVMNNLFYSIPIDETPSNAAGFPKFKSKTGIVPQTIVNNYFFNCEEREEKADYSFWSFLDSKDVALAGGGAILPADPCKNAAAGDFTLTNGVAMNANVGDPRWNPSRGGRISSEITVSNIDELLTAISAGKTTITLAAGTYDFTAVDGIADIASGKLTIVNSLTLTGAKDAVVIGGFQMGNGVENFTVKGITLDGASTIDNLLYVMDGTTMNKLSFVDVDVKNYKNRLIYQDKATSSVASVVVNRVTVTGVSGGDFTSGDFIDFRNGGLTALKVTNSTFANCIRTFARIDANVVCNSILVENNTFYNVCYALSKDNNGIMHVRSTSVTGAQQVIVRNNIFAGMHADVTGLEAAADNVKAAGFPKLVSKASAAIFIPKCSHNYFYDLNTTEPYSFWQYASAENCMLGYSVLLAEDPFKNAASGDFTLVNALAASEKVGDQRWNVNAGRYTGTAFEVADVPALLTAIDAGKTDLLLTGASYDFSAVDGSDAVLSGALQVGGALTMTGKLSHGVKPVITGTFNLTNAEGAAFVLNNLTLSGADSMSDMIVIAAGANLSKITLKNCDIKAYKNRLVSGPNESVTEALLVQGCTVTAGETANFTGGDFIDFRKGTIKSIKVVSNTFANCIRTFVRVDAAVICNAVNVEHNTFYNVLTAVSKDNNGILHVRSTTANANVRQIVCCRNIFASSLPDETALGSAADNVKAAGFPKLVSKASYAIAHPTCSDNLFFDLKFSGDYNFWNTMEAADVTAAGTVLEATPFAGDPAAGKFTVKTAYKGYGDLRW